MRERCWALGFVEIGLVVGILNPVLRRENEHVDFTERRRHLRLSAHHNSLQFAPPNPASFAETSS
jgi:hypothetical protein